MINILKLPCSAASCTNLTGRSLDLMMADAPIPASERGVVGSPDIFKALVNGLSGPINHGPMQERLETVVFSGRDVTRACFARQL